MVIAAVTDVRTDPILRTWAMTLYAQHGMLTPRLVREAARDPDSPAHAFVFDVEPDTAAEAYYLDRARRLIREVRVTVLPEETSAPRRVRLFHAVPSDDNAYVYLSLDDLVRQPDKMVAARTEALRRIKEAERALGDLDVLSTGAASAPATRRALTAVRLADTELRTPDEE